MTPHQVHYRYASKEGVSPNPLLLWTGRQQRANSTVFVARRRTTHVRPEEMVVRSVKAGWEKRFPDLSGKWTHWRLTGDGEVIALVPGENLLDALRLVEENYSRYTSIKCCRATVDKTGSCAEVQDAIFEIANLPNDNISPPRN